MSKSDDVAEEIRGHMAREGLRAGDRLGTEHDLAERYGVSRPTLREALRELSSAHLIRASRGPGGGIFVASTPEQGIGRRVSAAVASLIEADSLTIDELIETRLLLEVSLAGLAAQRAGDQDVARLKKLLAEAESESSDGPRVAAADATMHRAVAEIAGNRLGAVFIRWIVDVLHPVLHDLVAPALVEAVIVEQHRDLVRAIARGEPSAAERAMREHLLYLGDLVEVVRRSGSD
jgi:GntR family transcriptional regulator, transcriptional repressor for pyruvate dehydrogenase complex